MYVARNRQRAPGSSRNVLSISHFRGIDLYNSPSNVEGGRSPSAPNMVRDEVGKVRKRMGYHRVRDYGGAVNGAFRLGGQRLIHAGEKLYSEDGTELYSGMKDARSRGWQIGQRLYILDGKAMLCFDGEQVRPVKEMGYIPTVIISRDPEGGGTAYEPINMMQDKFTNSFYGKAGVQVYQLTDGGLSQEAVTARKMTGAGTWQELMENVDFTVNRATGQVTFTSAPGISPVTGEDNVKITAAKKREGYSDQIDRCCLSALYGVNGAADRLFVTGNPDFPNRDYYSAMGDPTYFGDLWYSVLGQENSRILGYSIVGDRLGAHKDEGEDGYNVIFRNGTLIDGKAAFPIVNSLQGPGAVSPYAFARLGKEPLFLTSRGVYAVTSEDITGEKYSQSRSFYINRALQKENGLEQAVAAVYGDFYLLAINSRIYVLDGLQKSYNSGEPYSSYQYECYLFEDITARTLWVWDGVLYFGTSDGAVFAFYRDPGNPESYNDDCKAIMAWWELPEIDGKLFYRNKVFRYLAVRLSSAVATSGKVLGRQRGIWKLLYEMKAKARYLDFAYIDFERFVFSSDTTPKTEGRKIRIKKADTMGLRLQNGEYNEPFGISDVAMEFTEGGKYRG